MEDGVSTGNSKRKGDNILLEQAMDEAVAKTNNNIQAHDIFEAAAVALEKERDDFLKYCNSLIDQYRTASSIYATQQQNVSTAVNDIREIVDRFYEKDASDAIT
jgi:hypothetical protein